MQQSRNRRTKVLRKGWELSNNSREHISLMLVQEIYSEGMVVEHGGSRTPVRVTRRIPLVPSAVVEGGYDQIGGG